MSNLSRRLAIALLSCAAAMPAALHAETPAPMAGKPEDVGLSSAQLKRLEAATKQNIDDGLMPTLTHGFATRTALNIASTIRSTLRRRQSSFTSVPPRLRYRAYVAESGKSTFFPCASFTRYG